MRDVKAKPVPADDGAENDPKPTHLPCGSPPSVPSSPRHPAASAQHSGTVGWAGSASRPQQESPETGVRQGMVSATCFTPGGSTAPTNSKQRRKCCTLLDLKLCTRLPASHLRNENSNLPLSPVRPRSHPWLGLGASRAASPPGRPQPLRSSRLPGQERAAASRQRSPALPWVPAPPGRLHRAACLDPFLIPFFFPLLHEILRKLPQSCPSVQNTHAAWLHLTPPSTPKGLPGQSSYGLHQAIPARADWRKDAGDKKGRSLSICDSVAQKSVVSLRRELQPNPTHQPGKHGKGAGSPLGTERLLREHHQISVFASAEVLPLGGRSRHGAWRAPTHSPFCQARRLGNVLQSQHLQNKCEHLPSNRFLPSRKIFFKHESSNQLQLLGKGRLPAAVAFSSPFSSVRPPLRVVSCLPINWTKILEIFILRGCITSAEK